MTTDRWSLAGRTALITCAASSLGAHFAAVLARCGASLILTDRIEGELERVANRVRTQGAPLVATLCDNAFPETIEGLASAMETIDILVNSPAVAAHGGTTGHSEAEWDAVVNTGLKGMVLLARAAGRGMQGKAAAGSIINLAPTEGGPEANDAIHGVARAVVARFTRALALEMAPFGVRVNAIVPGPLSSGRDSEPGSVASDQAGADRIPQRRLGRLDDFDGPLLLFASDASAYMTGTVLDVDGGYSLRGL